MNVKKSHRTTYAINNKDLSTFIVYRVVCNRLFGPACMPATEVTLNCKCRRFLLLSAPFLCPSMRSFVFACRA